MSKTIVGMITTSVSGPAYIITKYKPVVSTIIIKPKNLIVHLSDRNFVIRDTHSIENESLTP